MTPREKDRIIQKAIEKIIGDLTERKGIGDEWFQIDEDTRNEIFHTWKRFVTETYEEVNNG